MIGFLYHYQNLVLLWIGRPTSAQETSPQRCVPLLMYIDNAAAGESEFGSLLEKQNKKSTLPLCAMRPIRVMNPTLETFIRPPFTSIVIRTRCLWHRTEHAKYARHAGPSGPCKSDLSTFPIVDICHAAPALARVPCRTVVVTCCGCVSGGRPSGHPSVWVVACRPCGDHLSAEVYRL